MLALRGKIKFFLPLLGFVATDLVIGYGGVIPRRTEGVNGAAVGYGLAVLGACIAYVLGLWGVVSDSVPSAAFKTGVASPDSPVDSRPMSVYENQILPYLIHVSMRPATLAAYRQRVVPAAEGRVLEIGVGSGLNLPYYSAAAAEVVGLDPSPKLLSMAGKAARRTTRRIELLEGSAEAIPLDDSSVDTVVTTWTLCTIPDVSKALAEMRRVLKRNGRLLFAEHGRSPDPGVRYWQDRLTPVWRRIGGGCQLNRPIPQLVEGAGFRIEQMENGYMPGPKPMTYMYEGSARVR